MFTASRILGIASIVGAIGLGCAPSSVATESAASASTEDAGAGNGGPLCWPAAFTLRLNMALDPVLDPGNAEAARIAAVWAAAGDWNAELGRIGSDVRIQIKIVHAPGVPVPANLDWAADRGGLLCADRALGGNAHAPDFVGGHVHQFDGVNVASFGHEPGGLPAGPGWTGRLEQGPSNEASNDVLGETLFRHDAAKNQAEADVIFHTHRLDFNCGLLPWNYLPAALRPIGAFSFRSVALHEIGHALGLDHVGPDALNPANANNVMQPTLTMNLERVITPLERAALTRLYGPQGTCAPRAGAAAPAGKDVPMPGTEPTLP